MSDPCVSIFPRFVPREVSQKEELFLYFYCSCENIESFELGRLNPFSFEITPAIQKRDVYYHGIYSLDKATNTKLCQLKERQKSMESEGDF